MFTPGHVLKNGCKWVIESQEMLAMALEDLKSPSVCPSSVHITPAAAGREKQDLFCDFLYVIVRRKCRLHVTTDHFNHPNLPTTEEDKHFITQILRECNDGATRCTLEEFRGRLSPEHLDLLPFSLVSLGLPMATREDVTIVETIMKDPNRMAKLQELHLSVATTLHTEDVVDLTQYCSARLCLHASKLSDRDVEWLVDVVTALDKPFGRRHVGVDEISLPDSELTVKGLLELHRQWRKRDLKYPISVDADGIHAVAKKDLKKDYEKYGVQITFDTSRKPFKKWFFGYRKLMTMKHGNRISRITGSIHTISFGIVEVIFGVTYSAVSKTYNAVTNWRNRASATGHLTLKA